MFIILFSLFILLIINKNLVFKGSYEGICYFIKTILPLLYPNYIISDLLVETKGYQKITRFLANPLGHIFRFKYSISSGIFLLSLLVGSPMNAKLISNALEKKQIDIEEANYLLRITSVMGIVFILQVLSSLKLILLYYSIQIIIIILMRQRYNLEKLRRISLPEDKKTSLGACFTHSIRNNMLIMINILGVIVIAKIIISLLPEAISHLAIFLEIMSGTSTITNDLLLLLGLAFLGLSIQLQQKQILPEMEYKPYLFCLIAKILLVFILFLDWRILIFSFLAYYFYFTYKGKSKSYNY